MHSMPHAHTQNKTAGVLNYPTIKWTQKARPFPSPHGLQRPPPLPPSKDTHPNTHREAVAPSTGHLRATLQWHLLRRQQKASATWNLTHSPSRVEAAPDCEDFLTRRHASDSRSKQDHLTNASRVQCWQAGLASDKTEHLAGARRL